MTVVLARVFRLRPNLNSHNILKINVPAKETIFSRKLAHPFNSLSLLEGSAYHHTHWLDVQRAFRGG